MLKVSLRSTALVALVVAGIAGLSACGREPEAPDVLSGKDDGTNWASYGRTHDNDHFSPLSQIDERSVSRLKLAWYLDVPPEYSTYGAPLAVDGKLFYPLGLSVVHAVDAATGKALWSYDPDVASVAGQTMRLGYGARGLAYHAGKVLVTTLDGRLIALDAKSGKPVWTTQTVDKASGLYVTGAPTVFKDKVMIGNAGDDARAVRGYAAAYDIATGKQVWKFFTVPGDPAKGFENKAMEMAAKTWKGEIWKQGGGGAPWNSMTYDAALNRVYIGTGNGGPWNQKIRSPGGGDNLFLSSIVALDADTGAYIWHYQTNPGETWDYNSTMDIELATLEIDGKPRRVLLHAPKNGFFYVIDRDTGKLISAEPFAKVTWASHIDLQSGRPVENPEARYPNGHAVVWPFGNGAHNWQPMSYSPKARLVYIPTTNLPSVLNDEGVDLKGWQRPKDASLENGLNVDNLVNAKAPDMRGAPSVGALQAWDPVRQKQVWSVPMVSASNGGVISTGGNLVFQGQADGKFVARAAMTGKALWSFDAQNGMISSPITYMVGSQQFVTIITGFNGTAGIFGPLSANLGWDYRSQRRRVLTFALDGKARLPTATARAPVVPIPAPEFKIDAAMAKRGTVTYFNKCFVCHGSGAVAGGTAPDLRASGVPLDAEAFRHIVQGGALVQQRMPRFEELTGQDLDDLRHYIRQQARASSHNGLAGSF